MKLLKELYAIHSPSRNEFAMTDFLCDWMKKQGLAPDVDEKGNITVTKGVSDTYPCVVAHTDEVHRDHPEDYRVCQAGDVIYGFSPSKKGQFGIGADDKNGIWVALKAILKLPVIKVALFTGEEIGCTGSSAVNMDFFSNCRFVIQCDRRGGGDFIDNASSVPLCTKEFVALMKAEKYGYKSEHGLMTDVMKLRMRGLNVCCCNLSCGYYSPHTNDEVTVMSELRNCLAMVLEACRKITEVQPMAAYEPPKVTVYPSSASTRCTRYDDYDYGYDYGYGANRYGSWRRDGDRWYYDSAAEERETAIAYGREWRVTNALDVMSHLDATGGSIGVKKAFFQTLAVLKAVPSRMHKMTLSQCYYQKVFTLNTLKSILTFIDLEYVKETQIGTLEPDVPSKPAKPEIDF